MNDPPPPPVAPVAPPTDKSGDTASRAAEDTGGSRPVPLSGTPGTVPSDHPDAPHPAAAGEPARLGDYVVIHKLGEGGMGAVYLAEDTRLGRKVAVKTMKPELAANARDRGRFLREARAAAAVRSDYIVPIWGLGEAADGTPFIAMEFLEGETLDTRLRREPVAPVALILKVAREVGEGLAAAHAKGLIHRDIKPGNVWLEGDPTSPEPAKQVRRCKILDFGLARSVEKEDAQITASGAILGTPAYMAPEQARAEKVDHRADLFSLGVTLYRMAAGKPPFAGPTPMAVLIALTTEEPRPVGALAPNLPAELAELIDRLMNKDPAGRPQSAAELVNLVRSIAKGVQARGAAPTVLTPAPPAPVLELPPEEPAGAPLPLELTAEESRGARAPNPLRAKNQRGRLPWLIAAAVCSLVALTAGLWLTFGKKDGGPPPPTDPDRKAAEWVLSLDGTVGIAHDGKAQVAGAEDLPAAPFRLVEVKLANNKRVRDADLVVFRDCTNLTHLDLSNTPVSDEGLANFANCRNLKVVDLYDTRVGDDGLSHFKGCEQLEELALARTRVTDAGLVHLAGCANLRELYLFGTQVGDASLARIKQFTKLRQLVLRESRFTAEGVAELRKALPQCNVVWDDPAAQKADPDRKAAEYVLSLGGDVRINGGSRLIFRAADLPKEPFRLTEIVLVTKKAGTIPDPAKFSECRNLTRLDLRQVRVSHWEWHHFKNSAGLMEIWLSGAEVGDEGLTQIRQFTRLRTLDVGGTQVTAEGVSEFAKAMPGCKIEWDGGTIEPATEADRKAAEYVLSVKGSVSVDGKDEVATEAKELPKGAFRLTEVVLVENKEVTDASLAAFKECRNLTHLSLNDTNVGDTGVVNFAGCKRLNYLYLRNTRVGDATLTALKDCTELQELDLSGTRVSDASIPHLKRFTKLNHLFLKKTGVTEKGIAELTKGLPQCKIVHDGGAAEPAADADRKAAEWVLSTGGTVRVNGGPHDIADAKDFPNDRFRLTYVTLRGNGKVTDMALSVFKGCKHLATLDLGNTQAGDGALDHFSQCENLTGVYHGTRATDAAISQLKKFPKLNYISLSKSQVTQGGIDELHAALPGCVIEWDKGRVEPKQK